MLPTALITRAWYPVALAVRAAAFSAVIASAMLLPAATRAAGASVHIQNFAFAPATLAVVAGDTVTWTNADSSPHTITAENGAFDSGALDVGQSFSFTFTAPGTVAYLCDIHREMRGTIVVAAAQPPAAASVAPALTVTAAPATGVGPTAPAAASGDQPNTALPLVRTDRGATALVLVGLGLLLAAVGVLSGPRRPAPAAAERPSTRQGGGWRR